MEGKRKISRKQKFYNHDTIISIGYRVKSKVTTQFRQVRTVWDEEQEKWSFSIVDVVAVFTDVATTEQLLFFIQSIPYLKA